MVRYPRTPCGTTVTFSEYAIAFDGMLQGLPLSPSGNERDVRPLSDGPPNGPSGLRVSTTRHGVVGTNCNDGIMAKTVPPPLSPPAEVMPSMWPDESKVTPA